MQPVDLCLFLTSYTLTVAVAALAEFLRRREAVVLITVAVALSAVVATTVVGFYIAPGYLPDRELSYPELLLFLISVRDFSSVVALGMGGAAALVWLVLLRDRWHVFGEPGRHRTIRRCTEQALLVASVGGVFLGGQAFLWKTFLGITRHPTHVYAPEFVMEEVADLDDQPLRVAASDDGKVYVTYDYFKKYGAIGGAIIELSRDPDSGAFRKKVVVDSPFLVRPYGLAVRDGDLFVSRSGFFPKTSYGTVTYESTGAVTQLKDLDHDGYFEYAHDVVSGLPGVRGPDTMQQNNGIAFAPDGSLFVASAGAADRTIDEHPWGGTVLHVSPDFRQIDVYARGFRNPFEIALGPDNEVFVTDNDIDKNPGDEINHLVEGAHYGHPFVVPNEEGVKPSGFREPIFVGERESVFTGMAYATSRSLPADYRDCVYVTDFRQDKILRLKLVRRGDTYEVTGVHPFASVPTPVDIAATPSGEFFVISRRAQKVYMIRPRKPAARGTYD